MAPTSHQLAAAELALTEASERLSGLIREAIRDLGRREAALQAAEAITAEAAQNAVMEALDATREQARADAKREAATWMTSLIEIELQEFESNSSNARTLRRLLASVRGWAA